MTRYIVRRLLSLPLLLLGIVSIAFLISHFTQGDPLSSIVSERQMDNAEAVAAAKARWGLDKSLPEQYLIYVGNLLTGDLGISFRTKQPVSQDLLERLPATLELVIAAMLFGSITRHRARRARRALPRPGDRPCRAAVRADRIVDAGLLVRPDPALHLLGACSAGCRGRAGSMRARAPPDGVTGFFTIDALLAGDMDAVLGCASIT